jgi:hypothetical protein
MPLRILILVVLLLAPLAVARAHPIDDAALHERLEAQQRRLERQDLRIENQQRELDDVKRWIAALQQGAPGAAENASAADANIVASSAPDVAAAPMGVPASAPLQVADASVDTVDADPIPAPASIGGHETKPYFVDSSNIPTYLYVKTAARLHEDVTLRAHFEAGLQANPAVLADQKDENADFHVGARFFELIADTTKYGKLSFGHGFASSFLAFEVDQSGTQFGNLLSVGNTAGGLFFYDDDLNDYSETRVATAFIDGEELALINRIRYDSPRWAGLQLSGTVGQNDFRDVTLRFSGDAAGFVWSSGTSYQNRPKGPFGDWRWSIAGGVLHEPSGFNFTAGGAVSAGEDGDTTSGFTARLGWRYPLFELGETKFAVGYSNSWDVVEPGSEERSSGVFAFQSIDWAGLQLYTGYRWYHADVPSADLRNINVFVFGAAMQFDATWGF